MFWETKLKKVDREICSFFTTLMQYVRIAKTCKNLNLNVDLLDLTGSNISDYSKKKKETKQKRMW